ncbi:BrnT family toxin [bacterium]|nr:BrnT family toxin [bacterium]
MFCAILQSLAYFFSTISTRELQLLSRGSLVRVQHGAYPDEIEEIFYIKNKLRKTREDRYLLYGMTDEGRYLFVVFVVSRLAGKNVARVISARDMTKKEKSYYLKK